MDAVYVDWELEKLIERGAVLASPPLVPEQLQPNSLDLRLGRIAYRIKASFVPVGCSVLEAVHGGLASYELDLGQPGGAVLERHAVYLVPLAEQLRLPHGICARANPKSSTGRLDILCRLLSDDAPAFDEVRPGYVGPLYLEIVPQSFAVRARTGDSLAQLRLFAGDPVLPDDEVRAELGKQLSLQVYPGRPLPPEAVRIKGGIPFGVDLEAPVDSTIGFRAKANADPIDLRSVRGHAIRHYWERLYQRPSSDVILETGAFYILASRERVGLGPRVCAEMQPFDSAMGGGRSHCAGFFDSGFGHGPGNEARIVLELRNQLVPYRLVNRQPLLRLVILRNSSSPRRPYGNARGSHYQGQGLRLAKHFHESRWGDAPTHGPTQVPLFRD